MDRILRKLPKCLLSLSLAALTTTSALQAQEKAAVPSGGAVNITVTPGAVAAPPVSINLLDRHGHVTPNKTPHSHTGGGLIDVQSPTADTVVVTLSGAVVGNASMHFDLDQCFEVSFDDPKVKKAKITIEGRVIGLLRGEKKASADYSEATATITAGSVEVIGVTVPPHSVSGCENLSVNDHGGPVSVPVTAGKYSLHQCFTISAKTESCLGKRSSAEFAPDPALDTMWINFWEPFHGVKKDAFGYQVTIKVAADTGPAGEALPPPKESEPKQ